MRFGTLISIPSSPLLMSCSSKITFAGRSIDIHSFAVAERLYNDRPQLLELAAGNSDEGISHLARRVLRLHAIGNKKGR